MIVLRTVETDADIDTYLDLRNRVNAQRPMPREAMLDQRTRPGNRDLIAELDGLPAGVATVSRFGGDLEGELASLTLRVLAEHRRKGIGSALHEAAAAHARTLGKSAFFVAVRADDAGSLAYYGTRGFEERGRMQEVFLDLAGVEDEPVAPEGIELVPFAEEHDRAAWEVAKEADADIPSAQPIVTGPFEQWRRRQLGPLALRELSRVALEHGRVVGYAILGRRDESSVDHWMTGVARAARGRGIAPALKRAQLAAAKAAGWRVALATNDLGNDPMRRINERLGYTASLEWVHMVGPLSA